MNTEFNNLSDALKQLRIERGASLREFGDDLGISHAYLNKLERGTDPRTGKPITPTVETLTKIAEGLNMSLKKFMTMCGYFRLAYSANEPFMSESIHFDTEVSALIAQILPETAVFVGDAQLDENAKQALCDELRQLLIKMHNTYDSKG
ncbi:MAG: helix-turn-helix domain-containing protein [Defluviitaleaceae bacterium]|nr:helix-turn-helix domain-containing protein [Defluviitaleaceae bacterium]